MEQFILSWAGELLVAGILGVGAWSFRSWSNAIGKATGDILSKLDYLTKEFHQHRVDVERRVTRVETKMDLVHIREEKK